jgi:hypothetical protein
MTKTDELISKLEEAYKIVKKYVIATAPSDKDWGELKALESEISQLKEQIKKSNSSQDEQPELCPICEKTHLCNGVYLVCTRALCTPVKDITDEEMREYVTNEIKSHVIHPNPLTPLEMNILNLCCNYIKNHGKI